MCNKLVLNGMHVYQSVDKLETGFVRNPSTLGSFGKARTESVTFVNTNIRICSFIPDSSTAFIIFKYPCFMDDVSASLRGDATVPSAS